MRRALDRTLVAAILAALAVGGIALAGCGEEKESMVLEGEPLELGPLKINVQITRFLNPADVEDSAYLVGQPPTPEGMDYLAVFMEIDNDSGEEQTLPRAIDIAIVDTTERTYIPLATSSVFALDLGGVVPPHTSVPVGDSAAESGPIKGVMVLFLVDRSASENRPLELELFAGGQSGIVELDI